MFCYTLLYVFFNCIQLTGIKNRFNVFYTVLYVLNYKSNNMEKRKRIKNKWVRVLYLPLAILQWSFYTLIFSGLGICSISIIGFGYGIGNIILLKTEDAKEAFAMGLIPIVTPFIWWKDYITKGEIGMYE